MEGWIKLHRKMLDNPIVFKDSDYVSVWIYLLLNASHTEYPAIFKGEKILLKPGQLLTGRRAISDVLKVNESKVRRILEWFKNDQQIDQQTSNKNSLITILNWDVYQNIDQQDELQTENKRQTRDQPPTTNKNVKNIKNVKKVRNNNNTVCPELDKSTPSPPVISLPLNDNSLYGVSEADFHTWEGLYPNVDVMQELRKMYGWLDSNPSRRKTKRGIKSFITRWLGREQDKGGAASKEPEQPEETKSRVKPISEYENVPPMSAWSENIFE